MIQLPEDWSACERGNVYVVSPEGQHLAYFKTQEQARNFEDNLPVREWYWLEVSLAPENYPAFNVAVVKFTEEELVAHIHDNCDSWIVKKMNIIGVETYGSDNVYVKGGN
jgi:hypothetical protein